MNVVLFENVPNLGVQGSIVSVAPGYYRNYLSPRGLAVEATKDNMRRLESKLKRLQIEAQQQLNAAKSESERLEALTLKFQMKAGEQDKLFGSVTNTDIAEKLAEAGFQIDRHHINIAEPIKRLGMFTVEVKLHHEVTAKVKVLVEKED